MIDIGVVNLQLIHRVVVFSLQCAIQLGAVTPAPPVPRISPLYLWVCLPQMFKISNYRSHDEGRR